jgi:hypothetical protein
MFKLFFLRRNDPTRWQAMMRSAARGVFRLISGGLELYDLRLIVRDAAGGQTGSHYLALALALASVLVFMAQSHITHDILGRLFEERRTTGPFLH